MEGEQYQIILYQIGFCKEQRKALLPTLKQHPWTCVYCSDHATCKDHMLPLPYTGSDLRRSVPTLPSCGECNATLSDRVIPIFAERIEYLLEKYQYRYRKLLAGSKWSDEELKELGFSLRQGIERVEYKRRRLEYRLDVLGVGGLPCWTSLPLSDARTQVSVEPNRLDSPETGTGGPLLSPSQHSSEGDPLPEVTD